MKGVGHEEPAGEEIGAPTATDERLAFRCDGSKPPSPATVRALAEVCDRAGDHGGPGIVTVRVSGAPGPSWHRDLDVALVTKWERAVRRLERLPMATVAVVTGDCGGPALDALLATDIRIAAPGVRLTMPADGEVTWPGMALHRLTQQAGAAQVRQAVLFGVPIDAAEAVRLHLIDEIADDPTAALAAAAGRFGSFSGGELAIRRQLMYHAVTTSFEDALGPHLAACDRTLRRALSEVTA